MGTIHQLAAEPSTPPLSEGVEAFLRQVRSKSANTARAYSVSLRGLVEVLGADTPLWTLDSEETADQIAEWFDRRWGQATTPTHNLRLDAIRSAATYWGEQGWITTQPARRIKRHKRPADRARAVPRDDLEAFFDLPGHHVRDRTLWRLLYESAARSDEVLTLNVEGLNLANHTAVVVRKGGASDEITWRTGTAKLLPRMLKGRRRGPLFLTHRRARVVVPKLDLDPDTGRARLSYRRAAETFERATAEMPGGPWTLHQLRHSALTHAAEDGTSTPMLLRFSGHRDVRSLARYARVSTEALSRWQDERDEARRGR